MEYEGKVCRCGAPANFNGRVCCKCELEILENLPGSGPRCNASCWCGFQWKTPFPKVCTNCAIGLVHIKLAPEDTSPLYRCDSCDQGNFREENPILEVPPGMMWPKKGVGGWNSNVSSMNIRVDCPRCGEREVWFIDREYLDASGCTIGIGTRECPGCGIRPSGLRLLDYSGWPFPVER